MARKLSVDYSVLNIRVHPHPSSEIYVDLFQDAFNENRAIPIGNNFSAKINRLWHLNEDNPLDGLVGEIVKFNDINADSWVNIETGKSAEQDELDAIKIPKELKPNGKTFYFIFYPQCHLLVTEVRDKNGSFSAKMQEKFFGYVFSSQLIKDKYKAIDITLIPDTTTVSRIIESKTLKKLELIIHRPNPNDFGCFEEDVLAELEAENAKTLQKRLIAQDGKTLRPSDTTKEQIKVAARNGNVIYTDIDEETGLLNRNKSTNETPLIERDAYDPAKMTALDFIKTKAREILLRMI